MVTKHLTPWKCSTLARGSGPLYRICWHLGETMGLQWWEITCMWWEDGTWTLTTPVWRNSTSRPTPGHPQHHCQGQEGGQELLSWVSMYTVLGAMIARIGRSRLWRGSMLGKKSGRKLQT